MTFGVMHRHTRTNIFVLALVCLDAAMNGHTLECIVLDNNFHNNLRHIIDDQLNFDAK